MKKKVVVVEDFATSRNIIVSTLKREGVEVFEASDGREALQFFDGGRIDLLITDYNMPHMNGGELIEYIRNISTYEYIPILVLSTEIDKEKQERAQAARITGWIKKPFQVDQFMKIVKRALRI